MKQPLKFSINKLIPLLLVLFIGLISCGESYHEYTPEIIDVKHKADMPIIQYYIDSLREDFKDSLILMGYDEESIDIRDSIVYEKNGYSGGMASSGENFDFKIFHNTSWFIVVNLGDSIIKRNKRCNIQAKIKAIMQNNSQLRKEEYVTITVPDFIAELVGTSVESTPDIWEGVQVSSSQGLKYHVEFNFKGTKNWQEGQVDFYEKEQQDASACETGIYMGH